MEEIKVPYLCGGVLFFLLTEMKKTSESDESKSVSKGYIKGKKDPHGNPNIMQDLIISVTGNTEFTMTDSTRGKDTSNYRRCTINGAENIPFHNKSVCDSYDIDVRTHYSDTLDRMEKNLVNNHLDATKKDWLVLVLLALIENDESIQASDKFYIEHDGTAKTKEEMREMDVFTLPSFLVGVMHYILTNRRENTKGRPTLESFGKHKDKRPRKYDGAIGMTRSISVSWNIPHSEGTAEPRIAQATNCEFKSPPQFPPDDSTDSLSLQFYRFYNELHAASNTTYTDKSEWDEARISSDNFIMFAQQNFLELRIALPGSKNPLTEEVLPRSQCVSDKGHLPLFYARCLLMQGKILKNCPSNLLENEERSLYLRRANLSFKEAAKIAVNRDLAEQNHLEVGERPVASLIYSEALFLSADCYADLSEIGSTNNEEDLVHCFVTPGRKALEKAAVPLANIKNLYGANSQEYKALEQLNSNLSERFNLLLPTRAPAIHIGHEEKSIPKTGLIYSTAFDSASGKTPEDIELLTLQIAASPGVRLILQLPQLLDNPNVTANLLHHAGFQMLCSEGEILLSAFTPPGKSPIVDPKEYIIRNCQPSSQFAFSISEQMNLPDIRTKISRGLANDLPFWTLGLPPEMEAIYEGFRIASEIFRPSTVRRYHQDPSCRPSGISLPGKNVSLPQMIKQRIAVLHKDNALIPVAGRKELLSRMEATQQAAVNQLTPEEQQHRSNYYRLISDWCYKESYPKGTLTEFKALVDLCYGYSSGYRSSNRVLESPANNLFLVHSQLDNRIIDTDGSMAYSVNLSKKKASGNEQVSSIDFEEILRIARKSREVTAKSLETGGSLLAALSSETGLGYTADPSVGALATDFCVKSIFGDKNTSHISMAKAEENSEKVNLEFNTAGGVPG